MSRGICTNCQSKDNYNFVINNGLCNTCIAERLDELEKVKEENRWIPVEERLPTAKDKGYILRSNPKIGSCDVIYWGNTNWEAEQMKRYHTHWKPANLPEGK